MSAMTMPIILVLILTVISILLAIADSLLGSHGEKQVTINDETVFSVEGDDTLLNHLSDKKIFIPSACGGKGTCGHCKVKIFEGGGYRLSTEDIFLSSQEKKDGVRLACQVKVKEDMKITLPDELLSVQEYETEVIEIKDLTHKVKFVRLRLIDPDTIDFKPGQYAQIKVPGVEIFRAYSIASSPTEKNILDFVIRIVPRGIATTYVFKALDVGDKVTITGPYGDFYLQEDSDRDIICIARGTGKAPIRSILYYLKDKGIDRKVRYFYEGRTTKDLFYTKELMELSKEFPSFTYLPTLSTPTPEDKWTGEVGTIVETLNRCCGDLSDTEAYLCGSPTMIDVAAELLFEKGIKEENVHYDKF